ncbi:MAG: transcriptional regulator [Gammaproteobacteria bacterium]|nr:MAG: transcriptional regulator [Gammaproteobacteria bacterium]PIE37046.1 MAG: transcriptional regulator [Gammaproteobacteria bacterium]
MNGQQSILVVDDEPDIRSVLQEILEDEGYLVSTAENAERAEALLAEARPDLVLLDIWMPDTDGVSLLKSWRGSGTLAFPVIMISGHGTVETAVEATRLGAVDFIEKPLSLAKLLLTVEKALAEGIPGEAANQAMVDGPEPLPLLVGSSARIRELKSELESAQAGSTTVLLVGEGGSGRSAFAQALHRARVARTRFVHLRAETLTANNAQRELQGEEQGGTVRQGYLEAAAGGTLFISDAELLPKAAQSALSAVIEQQRFVRVGGEQRLPFTARVVTAARRDPEVLAREEAFDATLARQLAGTRMIVPPLRERLEDIPALLEAYVDWHVRIEGLSYRHFSVAAQNRLRNHDWPGNLLELKNLVQRVLLLGSGAEVDVGEINRALGDAAAESSVIVLRHDLPLREARADFERQYLLRCLADVQGNIGDLARHVGMERTHLYRKLRSLDIDLDKVRE